MPNESPWVVLYGRGLQHYQPDPARMFTACGLRIPATAAGLTPTNPFRCSTCDHQFTYVVKGVR